MRESTPLSLLPLDVSGKSFLEVGRTAGDYCLQAKNHGATRLGSVQLTEESIELGRCRSEESGVDIEFQHLGNTASWASDSFDQVLCLDALPYVRHPFQLLDHLVDVTRRRLVVEVTELEERQQKQLRLTWWRRWLLKGLLRDPIAFVGPNSLRTNRQTAYLSVEAVRRFLAEHRQSFCQVRVVPSPRDGKSLVIADKRRIGRLVVIAGPTSAGKSTLIDRIERGKLATLCDRVGLDDLEKWESKEVYGIARDSRRELDRVIMHYDFTTRLKWDLDLTAMTDLVDVVHSADEATFVTLWTEPERLREQFEENEIQRHLRTHGELPTNKKTLRLREDYKDPNRILSYYRDWFRFASSLTESQYIVSQSSDVMTVSEWSERHDPAC